MSTSAESAMRQVLARYRTAQIASREYDEGDAELDEAWRAAYLAHLSFDPTLARSTEGAPNEP